MSHSWLQRKRKGELIDLAQKAGLPKYVVRERMQRVWLTRLQCRWLLERRPRELARGPSQLKRYLVRQASGISRLLRAQCFSRQARTLLALRSCRHHEGASSDPNQSSIVRLRGSCDASRLTYSSQ
jgi:hypothetical protein